MEILNLGFDEDTQQGRIDTLKHRRLWIGTVTPAFDTIAPQTHVKTLERWFQKYDDLGTSMLFKALVRKSVSTHMDRAAMATTMGNLSPKLSWLAGFLAQRCIDDKRKVLIFCHWPFTEQQVEAFRSNLQFRILSIQSSHTPIERDRVRLAFNDPSDDSEVLITSIRVSSSSVNLHHHCSDVVFVDVPMETLERVALTERQMEHFKPDDALYDHFVPTSQPTPAAAGTRLFLHPLTRQPQEHAQCS